MGFFESIGKWFSEKWPDFSEKFMAWLGSTGLTILQAILLIIIGFWVGSIIARIIRSALRRSKVDKGIIGFVVSCVRVGIKVIVLIMAIATLGLNVTSIITALGAAGITIGLAMQDSLSNFASGVLILFNKPFVAGDFIELEESGGTVKDISLMYTTLVNSENKEVIYPNSKVTAAKIINHTALDVRRIELQFSVSVNSDVSAVKSSLNAAVETSPFALSGGEYSPIIGIREFGEGRIVYDLRVWIKTNEFWSAYYDIEERVYKELNVNGVELARGQMDVRLQQH